MQNIQGLVFTWTQTYEILKSQLMMEKNIDDNKTFWKTIKPLLSDKVRSTNKITLIDKEEIVVGDYNTAKVLSAFYSNILTVVSQNIRTENLLLTISGILF